MTEMAPEAYVPDAVTSLAPGFWAKVDKSGDCWMWNGCKATTGYGVYGRGTKLAHRLAYADRFGNIPPGLMIDHKCRNRACVNPDHLQAVTNQLNQQNRSGPPSNNTSGVMGVHWCPRRKMWRASVRHNGKRHYAGYFHDIEDAAVAVRDLRNRLFSNNLADRRGAA